MEINQHGKAAHDRRTGLEKEVLGKLRFNGIELKIIPYNHFTGQVMWPLELEIFIIQAAKPSCLLDSIPMGMVNVCLRDFSSCAILQLINSFYAGNMFSI